MRTWQSPRKHFAVSVSISHHFEILLNPAIYTETQTRVLRPRVRPSSGLTDTLRILGGTEDYLYIRPLLVRMSPSANFHLI